MAQAKEGGRVTPREWLSQALLSGKQRLGRGAGLRFRRNKTRNKSKSTRDALLIRAPPSVTVLFFGTF